MNDSPRQIDAPRGSRLRRLRAFARLASILALGAVLASLVAWGAAWRASGEFGNPREYIEHIRIADARRLMHHGRRCVAMGVSEVTLWPEPDALVHPHEYDGLFYDLDPVQLSTSLHPATIPRWARRATPPTPDCLRLQWVTTRACGFPFRMYALMNARHTIAGTNDDPPSWDCIDAQQHTMRITSRSIDLSSTVEFVVDSTWGGAETPMAVHRGTGPRFGVPPGPWFLPLIPIWPGLLANTAIYTAIIWTLCWSIATLRRRIHRWRHPSAVPCPKCRYDLAGLDTDRCPECGQATLRPEQSETNDHAT